MQFFKLVSCIFLLPALAAALPIVAREAVCSTSVSERSPNDREFVNYNFKETDQYTDIPAVQERCVYGFKGSSSGSGSSSGQ